MTILVCDAGGTHIRFTHSEDGNTLSEPQKFKLSEFPDFESVVMHFLSVAQKRTDEITSIRLSFGDLNPWKVTAEECVRFLPHAEFLKVNDFEANSWGIATASEDEFLLLNNPHGTCSKGASKCVIGSGTGLGFAYICETKHGPYVQRAHGGQMLPSFGSEEHRDVFESVERFRHSDAPMYEDVLSGPGMFNVYKLLADRTHTHKEYRDTNDMIEHGRGDPLVQQTLRLFHEILGIFAYQALAFGFSYKGIYLTGGVIDRLVGNNLFDFETFEKFFKRDNVTLVWNDTCATPVYWVKDEFIALKGLLEIEP
ncbi:MAG TPA: glucokinase [Alphaproteobacteria bacterium]|nr:glucokinase [Alphaproteobacteria bacterium]HNS43780.1 glucokinase [Alphaproteobacteria bacterium]